MTEGFGTFQVESPQNGGQCTSAPPEQSKYTVAQLTIQTLENWGVSQIFGKSSYSDSGLIDALSDQQDNGGINYYELRQEATAAFACSAYGKLTGRPAACLAASGSNASNLLSSLWDANVDRAPVIALTGPLSQLVSAPSVFHEVDHVNALGKIAQFSQTVHHNSRHAEIANLACKSAILNRGVSHLIFSPDIAKKELSKSSIAGSPTGRLPSQNISPPNDALTEAIQLLREAERPVIIVGHGARGRMEAVIQLAEQLRSPVLTTFKGKGLIPDHHPLAGGVLSRSGTSIANSLMDSSDSLLVFGASFSPETGIRDDLPTVQVDYDLKALARSCAIDVPVWGEIGVTAQALSDDFLGDMWTEDQTAAIASHRQDWQQKQARLAQPHSPHTIHAGPLFNILSEKVDNDAIITVDLSSQTAPFGQYFVSQKQTILLSGHSGSVGFSFPAAMGAWSATQESEADLMGRQVVSISNVAGFKPYLDELATAVDYQMNITHILLRTEDEQEGTPAPLAVKNWKQQQSQPQPLLTIVEESGALSLQASDSTELAGVLEQALKHNGPAVVEVITRP